MLSIDDQIHILLFFAKLKEQVRIHTKMQFTITTNVEPSLYSHTALGLIKNTFWEQRKTIRPLDSYST
jgi:hypothetical protein